ncbi:MAG: dienelactone hydrolase family protein, partial [Gammaproteobacteria bacterium]|nr:dienelactone hydrolase family protein [Gammaproteobacteria bacterium]
HIREVVDSYAAEGYAALAPALFDRVERDVELGYDQAGMSRGRELAFAGLSRDDALRDLQAAIEEAGKYGKVGVVGYCYGGLMTWLAACHLEGIACASAYYGGGIANELAQTPNCPLIMHFGELDAHIPQSDVLRIREALPNTPVHVYPADHGFNCDHRGSYHAPSADTARRRTLALFRDHVG